MSQLTLPSVNGVPASNLIKTNEYTGDSTTSTQYLNSYNRTPITLIVNAGF